MLQELEQQTKLTKNQWLIAGAATIGDMLDFFDFGLIAFVLAFIVKDWHLTFGEVGIDPLGFGHQRAVRLAALGLGGRQDRPAQGDDRHGAEHLDRHRGDGADPRARLDLPGDLPAFRRLRRDRHVLGRHHGNSGICAHRQARLADRTDDNDAAGGFPAWRAAVGLCHTLYRLARPVCCRPAAGVLDPLHPRLGPRIAVLADAHGALRRGAPIARLGIADRPQGHRPAGRSAHGRAHALDSSCSNIRAASSPAP